MTLISLEKNIKPKHDIKLQFITKFLTIQKSLHDFIVLVKFICCIFCILALFGNEKTDTSYFKNCTETWKLVFDEPLDKMWYNGKNTVEICRWVFEMKEDVREDFLSLDIVFTAKMRFRASWFYQTDLVSTH